jgi:hypothetical protein
MKGAGKIPPTMTLSPPTKESLLQASRRHRAYRVAGIASGSVASGNGFLDGIALDVAGPVAGTAPARPDSMQSRPGVIQTGPRTRSTDCNSILCYSIPQSQLALARLPG